MFLIDYILIGSSFHDVKENFIQIKPLATTYLFSNSVTKSFSRESAIQTKWLSGICFEQDLSAMNQFSVEGITV